MDQENVVFVHNGILFSHEEYRNLKATEVNMRRGSGTRVKIS
jgi:hypothetical protein